MLRKTWQQCADFSLRTMQSKRKEEEILNRLSDRVYDAEDRLDGFCKAVDKQVEVFRSELRRKASSHITSITIEYKYKAEHLVVKFDRSSGRTSCIDGVYTCQEARKGSRMHALHSGIEEPPNLTTIQQHQPPATVMPVTGGGGAGFTTAGPETTTAPRPTKHRRMLIEDDEDVSYQHEVARSRAAAEAEVARLAALEAQKAPDFGFHYSIDAEKREFGAAVELLAMPTHADLGQDDGKRSQPHSVCSLISIT